MIKSTIDKGSPFWEGDIGGRAAPVQMFEGRVFQAEGIASAKALRRESAWYFPGLARPPEWL